MKYIPHKIVSGERIDQLSLKYYGRVDAVEPIYKANPKLKFNAVLEQWVGETIYIPIDDEIVAPTKLRPGIKGVPDADDSD